MKILKTIGKQQKATMPNYNNGKIYSIRSRSRPDLVYVGSTVRRLSERFGKHKLRSNYTTSKQIIDLGDAYIELIENYPCNSKEELCRREGEIMRTMECVNRCIAGRTKAEYRVENAEMIKQKKKQYYEDNKDYFKQINKQNNKQYYKDNKDYYKQIHKQYREKNKDKINQRMKQYYENNKEPRTCVCGGKYNYGILSNRNRHYNSKKHIKWVDEFYERLSMRF